MRWRLRCGRPMRSGFRSRHVPTRPRSSGCCEKVAGLAAPLYGKGRASTGGGRRRVMADETGDRSGPPGGKRRRPPTTIDVKATEIASDPVKSAEAAETAAESGSPDPGPTASVAE